LASKWRQNIADIGAVGAGYELCARFISGGEGFEYLCKKKGITATWQLMTPIVFEDFLILTFTIRPSGGKRFPGDYDVERDVT